MRRAFADALPAEVAGRGKSGFGVPLADWFRGELRGLAADVLVGIPSFQNARTIGHVGGHAGAVIGDRGDQLPVAQLAGDLDRRPRRRVLAGIFQ